MEVQEGDPAGAPSGAGQWLALPTRIKSSPTTLSRAEHVSTPSLGSKLSVVATSKADGPPKQLATDQKESAQCLQQSQTPDQRGRCPLKRLPGPKLGLPPCSRSAEVIPHERPWKYKRETPLGHPRGLGHGSRCPLEPDHLRQYPLGLGSGLRFPPELPSKATPWSKAWATTMQSECGGDPA